MNSLVTRSSFSSLGLPLPASPSLCSSDCTLIWRWSVWHRWYIWAGSDWATGPGIDWIRVMASGYPLCLQGGGCRWPIDLFLYNGCHNLSCMFLVCFLFYFESLESPLLLPLFASPLRWLLMFFTCVFLVELPSNVTFSLWPVCFFLFFCLLDCLNLPFLCMTFCFLTVKVYVFWT